MRYLLWLFLVVGLSSCVAAQPLLDTLAVRVCDCMGATPEIVYPRLQANRCVTTVSTAYAGRIRSELRLSSRKASDRQRLGELLVDPLTELCPLLRELGPGIAEPQLSYNDRALLKKSSPDGAQKWPPADDPATITQEGAEEYELSGTLTEVPSGDRLRILTKDGRKMTLALPRNLARRHSFVRGQPVHLVFRDDWRTDGREIIPTVVRILD